MLRNELKTSISAVASTLTALLLVSATSIAADAPQTGEVDKARVESTEVQRDLASKANTDAARLAIKSVQADNKLDLDIRLIGPTSVKIASKR